MSPLFTLVLEYFAGEKPSPVALEIGRFGAIPPTDRSGIADETVADETDEGLSRPIICTLGAKSIGLERPQPGDRNGRPLRIAYRAGAATAAAFAEIGVQRGEHRLGNQRHLPPLQGSGGLVHSAYAHAARADPRIEVARVRQRGAHALGGADEAGMIAHARLHLAFDLAPVDSLRAAQ